MVPCIDSLSRGVALISITPRKCDGRGAISGAHESIRPADTGRPVAYIRDLLSNIMRSKSGIGLKGNIGARKGINMQVPSSNIAAGHSVPQREDVEGRRSIKLGLDSHQSRTSTGRDEANTEELTGVGLYRSAKRVAFAELMLSD